ncbi:MAG: hypothetical protein PGN16_04265 [Sphingomonas phyllosphaerae]|uniref:hypothetical protein n=1 Tax=Sphingomonas phyllosphaerae TaxID=257003 RepID=UPI002FFBBD01
MTHEDASVWIFFLAGLLFGWWWRGRAEQKAHREDLPQWMAVLGRSLATQIHRTERHRRFVGEGVTISNTQTYAYADNECLFDVTVTRKQPVTIDQ